MLHVDSKPREATDRITAWEAKITVELADCKRTKLEPKRPSKVVAMVTMLEKTRVCTREGASELFLEKVRE